MKKHFNKFLEKNPTVQQKLLGEGKSMLDIYKRYKAHVKKESSKDPFWALPLAAISSPLIACFSTAASLPPFMVIGGAAVGGLALFYGFTKLFNETSRQIAESRMDFEVRYMRPNRRLVVN